MDLLIVKSNFHSKKPHIKIALESDKKPTFSRLALTEIFQNTQDKGKRRDHNCSASPIHFWVVQK